jgi:hypothetical protein
VKLHATADIPIVLFGAFDRHNFGDLLFPHIAAALLKGKKLVFTGLAERDMRTYGGHQVLALAQVAAHWGERRVNIFHVGGELLTCDAWEAAVMLLPPREVQEIIARLDAKSQERLEWARHQLGVAALAPYTLNRALFPHAAKVIYHAVGGVGLDERDPALRAEVSAKLKAADEVSVRETATQALLRAAGIRAQLIPDPAVMVADLFGMEIRARAETGELAKILRAFPQGYIAVQFSADFGDDQTLNDIAVQLDQIAISSGYGVTFFRAGAAPWHDDLLCYERIAARMRSPSIQIFTSLNLWDICSLIAGSRVYCGSSLHGRIVALAFALPRINLRHPTSTKVLTKQSAFAATWEEGGMPATVEVHDLAEGIHLALRINAEELKHTARELVAQYRQGFNAICAALDW